MRTSITALLLMGAISGMPVVGFAAPVKAQTPATAKRTSTRAATHATKGVVKSIDASTLVINSTGKKHGEMTFMLNDSTQREGTVAAGSPVSIRYREDGKTNVATAIRVEQPKQQAAAHAAPTKK